MPQPTKSDTRKGVLHVEIEPIPDVDPESDEWDKWCDAHDCRNLGSGRRAWHHELRTYIAGATGLVSRDGELIDLWYEPLPAPERPAASAVLAVHAGDGPDNCGSAFLRFDAFRDGDEPADMVLLVVGPDTRLGLVCSHDDFAKFAADAASLRRAFPNG